MRRQSLLTRHRKLSEFRPVWIAMVQRRGGSIWDFKLPLVLSNLVQNRLCSRHLRSSWPFELLIATISRCARKGEWNCLSHERAVYVVVFFCNLGRRSRVFVWWGDGVFDSSGSRERGVFHYSGNKQCQFREVTWCCFFRCARGEWLLGFDGDWAPIDRHLQGCRNSSGYIVRDIPEFVAREFHNRVDTLPFLVPQFSLQPLLTLNMQFVFVTLLSIQRSLVYWMFTNLIKYP